MRPIVKMILTVVVTALVIGGGTYWYVNNKATTDKTALQSTIDGLNANVTALNKKVTDLTPTAVTPSAPAPTTTTPTTASEPTAKSNTYTNTKLGFSFKYPTDWNVHVTSDETTGNSFVADITPADGKLLYTIGFSHTILNYDNKDINTQFTYLKSSAYSGNTDFKVLTSQSGITYSGVDKGGSKQNQALFATGKYIIGFSYYAVNGNQTTDYAAGKTIFDEVISTFAKL